MPQNICTMWFLFPSILFNRPNPLTVGLGLCWHSSLVVLFGYLLILPFALLGGMNLAGTTLTYFADIFPALSPVAEVVLSHWLLYSYFHYAVAPLAALIFQGGALTLLMTLALSPIVVVLSPAAARALVDFAFERHTAEYIRISEFPSQTACSDQPTQLFAGWTHGHHPPILYEQFSPRFVVRLV